MGKCDIILPGCKPVCSKLVGNVVSLKAPKGTCLKFFASVDCKGTPSTYRGAYTVDAEGMPDLKGTPASEWKAIGDCSQPIGVKYLFPLFIGNLQVCNNVFYQCIQSSSRYFHSATMGFIICMRLKNRYSWRQAQNRLYIIDFCGKKQCCQLSIIAYNLFRHFCAPAYL